MKLPNLRGWMEVMRFGFNSTVYAKGNERMIIDRRTGQLVRKYKVGGNHA